jgi:hypothetical protein
MAINNSGSLDDSTRTRIRHIFLSPRPNFALMTAAELLGMTLKDLRQKVKTGAIVAISTRLGQRVAKEEVIFEAMGVWEQAVMEEALGEEAASVLPEAIRLVELRARVPRYQRDMLRALAEWEGTTVDQVLSRELEGVASSYSTELAAAVLPGFAMAMRWPTGGAGA